MMPTTRAARRSATRSSEAERSRNGLEQAQCLASLARPPLDQGASQWIAGPILCDPFTDAWPTPPLPRPAHRADYPRWASVRSTGRREGLDGAWQGCLRHGSRDGQTPEQTPSGFASPGPQPAHPSTPPPALHLYVAQVIPTRPRRDSGAGKPRASPCRPALPPLSSAWDEVDVEETGCASKAKKIDWHGASRLLGLGPAPRRFQGRI